MTDQHQNDTNQTHVDTAGGGGSSGYDAPTPPNQPKPTKPRWLIYTLYALLACVMALVLLFVLLFYAAGTQGGTQFLLDKITQETGTKFKYTQGNLRDGVWLSDIEISPNKELQIHARSAYVQVGWRAILARQVHLVDLQVDDLTVIDKKPPSGKPFDYATIDLPITLKLDRANIKKITYQQATKDPVYLHDIHVKSGKWSGTTVTLDGASIRYDDVVSLDKIQGKIDLIGDYPLDVSADVDVSVIKNHYFGTLKTHATGTLKRTVGTLTSTYHGYEVAGEFIAQGLDEDSPFYAKLDFDKVVLPYATEQNITLTDGSIIADGVVKDIGLRINTNLSAKDIPSGRYRGRGVVRDGGMDIPFLQADTPNGVLRADGRMEWSDEFELHANIQGDGYQIRQDIPKEYQDYQAYLPQTLTGELGVRYFVKDKDNHTRFELDLTQQDGEKLQAVMSQSQSVNNAPWQIQTSWQNLIRSDVPNLDRIDSPSGTANIRIEQGWTHIDAQAKIKALSAAPMGDYAAKIRLNQGEQVLIDAFDYHGVMGKLSGVGQVNLPNHGRPLAWQADLTAHNLMPNAYFPKPNATPIHNLTGRIHAAGTMRTDAKMATDIHQIRLSDTDLSATLTDGQNVAVAGVGDASIHLNGSDVRHFQVEFDGDVKQSLLPSLGLAKVGLNASGNLAKIDVSKLTLATDAGTVAASGKLMLDDGVGWDINANLDRLDTQKLSALTASGNGGTDFSAVLSGNLITTGRYRNDKLSQMTAKFDGDVGRGNLGGSAEFDGKLMVDVVGRNQRYDIKHLTYQGSAGDLTAQGFVDLTKGYAWNVSADMNHFDVSAFIKEAPSDLTGGFSSQGNWQKHSQMVAVDRLDLQGSFRQQPIRAQGSFHATFALPQDLRAYANQLKMQSAVPTNANDLVNFRQHIDRQAQSFSSIVKRLHADDLSVSWGDNTAHINSDQSQLTARVAMSDLSQIVPSVQGAVKGGAILMDDGQSLPTIYIDVAAGGVRTQSLVAREARILGKVANLGQLPSQLLVDAKDIVAAGRVLKAVRADFHGTEQNHTLALKVVSDENQVQAKLKGGLNRAEGRYRGVLSDGNLHGKFGQLTQKQPAEFSYTTKGNQLAVAAHCWQATDHNTEQGVLCLQDALRYSDHAGSVNLVVQNLDTSVFSVALPKDIHWQSTLSGKVQAWWQHGQNPVVNAVLYSDNGRVGLDQDGAYVQMPYERVSLIAQSVAEGLKLRADVAGAAARGYADVVVNPYQADKPISGALLINDINLAVLRPFFQDIQTLSGTVNVAGGLGGTLKQPLFYGNADLSNGALALVGVPVNLSKMTATMQVRGTSAELSGDFMAGQGVGYLMGGFDWSKTMQAKLRVFGEDLEVNQPPLLSAKVTPDVEVIVRPFEQYVNIQGVVSVPNATIRPPESTANIVGESGDVVVLDRRATGNIDQVLAVTAPWSINADLGLDLGDEVVFRGLGAKLPLAGALHLTQSGQGSMRAKGVVQVAERTTIDGIGQNLELNYAQIRFNGDVLNPRLSIEGEKQIEGQTVGVRVKGTANNPEITVFNDAGLTEQQAMNALVTGRITESADSQISEQGFRSQVTNNLAAAGLNFGLAGTRNITNQIGQAFGLESLTIDASGNSNDTSVSVTGYLSPDLYIRYGVGLFNAQSALSMRYQLTRRIYIEAASATEKTVDAIYRWKF